MAKAASAGKKISLSSKRQEFLELQKDYYLYEIVKDIVAARIICLDQTVLETILSLVLRSETFRINDYEIYRPFFWEYERQSDGARNIFFAILNDQPEIISKPSNYESTHLEITFGAPVDRYPIKHASIDRTEARGFSRGDSSGEDKLSRKIFDFRMRLQHQLFKKLNRDARKAIPNFPFELQLRTYSQHIWAQDEHRYVYSPHKSGTISDVKLLEQTRSAFTGLKFFLSSSDTVRQLIRKLHNEGVGKSDPLEGHGMEVGTRLYFFRGDQFKNIRDRLVDLDSKTTRYLQNRKVDRTKQDFWKDAIKFLHSIVQDAAQIEDSYFNGRHDGDGEYWGRQRVIAMILGFILLFCIEDAAQSGNSDQRKREALRLFLLRHDLRSILGTLIVDSEHALFPNYTANLAARVYEFIKTNDRYFLDYGKRNEFEHIIFDPLIFARNATALYRMGEFAGAYRTLSEFFESRHYDSKYWSAPAHQGHSELELRGRLLQYQWYRNALDYEQIIGSLPVYESLLRDIEKAISKAASNDSDVVEVVCWATWIWGALQALKVPISGTLKSSFERLYRKVENALEQLGPVELKKPYLLGARAIHHLRNSKMQEAQSDLVLAEKLIAKGVPHPAPAVRIQNSMIAILKSEFAEYRYTWDVFVSYSTEDRQVARELASKLKEHLAVFIDYENVYFGDPITPIIEKGLRESRHIVMLVTPTYIKRKWTEIERISFATQEVWIGDRKFFVILKDVSLGEFRSRFPTLADRHVLQLNGERRGSVADIASSIFNSLGKSLQQVQKRIHRRR